MFSSNPEKDFSRERKLPLKKVISILLSMQGGTLTTELLKYFNCSLDTASSSAFVQQRNKQNSFAFPTLFDLFIKKTDSAKLYKGFRLLAADGSDFKILHNPDHTASSLCPFLHKNTLKTFFSLKCVLFLGFVLLAIS